ncbi:MAG: type transport system permease protein [Chloroflexota bacterium]|jgi:ABC-type transport system involved in multi-copper enzyme maturation permease subunit|nr:type transport system permease protein [Chloroflexota bacterium]
MTTEPLEPAGAIDDRVVEAVATMPVQTDGAAALVRRRSLRLSLHPVGAVRNAINGIVAVGVKELRGRVRGRRAFVVLTFYLLFLAAFAWAWELVAERAYVQSSSGQGGSAAFASALVGQEVFGALVLVETLLVVFLAPAFTSGAISLEREKQTLDMLAATPISSLSIVVGKLLSALAYVFLLIAASIPLTAIVFVFGGVGPDDVVRAYAVLIVSALGLGSLGLFISAAMQRTQGATVVTFFAVLFLTLGTMFGVLFWNTMSGVGTNAFLTGGSGVGPIKGRAPEAFLWFNPFAAQYDVICGASGGYGGWCTRLNNITNGAISTGSNGAGGPIIQTPGNNFGTAPSVPVAIDKSGVINGNAVPGVGPNVIVNDQGVAVPDPQPFGVPRDTFWPRSLEAWGVMSLIFILASIQLVTPTRRWRFLRRPSRGIA